MKLFQSDHFTGENIANFGDYNLQEYAQSIKDYHIQYSHLFTEYENPSLFKLLHNYYNALLYWSSAKTLKGQLTFGTLPHGEVNAIVYDLRFEDVYVILFHSGMFGYCNLISKCFVSSCDLTFSKDHCNINLLEDSEQRTKLIIQKLESGDILRRFMDVAFAYLRGNPLYAPQYFLKQPLRKLHDDTLAAMESFVLSHEIGHIMCGHFSCSSLHENSIEGKAERVYFVHNQEFEADLSGVALLKQYVTGQQQSIIIALGSVSAYFCGLDILTCFRQCVVSGEWADHISSTHPTSEQRLRSIRLGLANVWPEEWWLVWDYYFEVARCVKEKLQPIAYRLRDDLAN